MSSLQDLAAQTRSAPREAAPGVVRDAGHVVADEGAAARLTEADSGLYERHLIHDRARDAARATVREEFEVTMIETAP